MILVQDRSPRAVIALSSNAPWLEQHAAEELQRYLRQMSGAEIPLVTDQRSGPRIAVGSAASVPAPAGDEFIIRVAGDELAIRGGSDRATLWAAYCLLEDHLGIGFFRDGERVPDTPTVDVAGLDVHEVPRFPNRFEGNGCIYHYSTSAWGWDEWKREYDWRAKRRVTRAWPMKVGGDVMKRVLQKWDVIPHGDTPAPSSPLEMGAQREKTIHERARDYGQQLGIAFPVILPTGSMPAAFYEKFPDAKTILLQWSELKPYRILHPADPMLKKLIVDYIQMYRELYGTDHLYIAEFTSESRVLEGADDIQEVRRAFVRSVSAAIREADPEGIWIPTSWSFDIQPEDPSRPWEAAWTPDAVRDYCDTISVPFEVHDLWSEGSQKYRRLDYFWGHKWGYGVLHSFAAGGYIHGDVSFLVKDAHELLTDPRAKNCVQYGTQSEVIDFNGFYLELAARLSWDPARVTLDGFIADYCRLRYGSAGEELHESYRLLAETAYGPDSGVVNIILDPLYWFRPNLDLVDAWPHERHFVIDRRKSRPAWMPKLKRAAELFLAQEDLLRDNQMAVRDLVDITRQWVIERFNIVLQTARDAFLAGDSAAFERDAAECMALLDKQTRLTSSWPPYRFDRKIERERPIWGDDVVRAIKHSHVWVSENPDQRSVPLRDYYRQDLDGLIADYYSVRVAAYFDLLRERLAEGVSEISDEEFDALYSPIEEEFIAEPVRSLPQGDPVEVAREIIAAA